MGQRLQHRGVVDSVDAHSQCVVVSVIAESACAGCHAKGICGQHGDKRLITVNTPYASHFTPGESVIVALERGSMAILSVARCYVVPLLILLGTLFGAHALGAKDEVSALSSLLATAAYYAVLYAMRSKFDKKIKFTIIKE